MIAEGKGPNLGSFFTPLGDPDDGAQYDVVSLAVCLTDHLRMPSWGAKVETWVLVGCDGILTCPDGQTGPILLPRPLTREVNIILYLPMDSVTS